MYKYTISIIGEDRISIMAYQSLSPIGIVKIKTEDIFIFIAVK